MLQMANADSSEDSIPVQVRHLKDDSTDILAVIGTWQDPEYTFYINSLKAKFLCILDFVYLKY